MNRPGFWLRLRWFWATTALGRRWPRHRTTSFMAVLTPGPIWRRFWYVFKPPPPPPPTLHPGPPPWLQPPESELGVAVPMREILASDAGVVIALIDCVAYSTGFEFTIALRTKDQIDAREMGFGPPSARGERQQMQMQFGIQFADGSTAVSDGNLSPELIAQLKMHAEGQEPLSSDGPILAPRSGGGGGKRWDFQYWVWPLPPQGRLTITCEWPSRGIALTSHDLDGAAIRRAGAASPQLWNDA